MIGRRRLGSVLLAAALLGAASPATRAEDGATYAPVYSHLWHGDLGLDGRPQKLLLAATISVRNLRLDQPVTILAIDYHNQDGKLLRRLLDQPTTLAPLASLERFIPRTDDSGGSGAGVVVRWRIEGAGPAPLVETLHAYLQGSQSMAFVSPGRPLDGR